MERKVQHEFGINNSPSYSTIKRYMKEINEELGKIGLNQLK